MRLFSFFRLEFREMLRRRDFAIAFSVSLAVSLASFLYDAIALFGTDRLTHYAAWFTWGPIGKPRSSYTLCWGMIFMFALPFLSALAFSPYHYDNRKSGVINPVLTRCGRRRYYISTALVTFIGGFLVIFVPMLLNQLLCLLVAPVTSMQSIAGTPFNEYESLSSLYFPGLFANSPYLYNFIFMLLPSAVGGLFALLSYSVSLFVKKYRFFVLTIPAMLYVVSGYVVALGGRPEFTIGYMIDPIPAVYHMRFIYLAVLMLILLAVNTGAVIYKIMLKRDEV